MTRSARRWRVRKAFPEDLEWKVRTTHHFRNGHGHEVEKTLSKRSLSCARGLSSREPGDQSRHLLHKAIGTFIVLFAISYWQTRFRLPSSRHQHRHGAIVLVETSSARQRRSLKLSPADATKSHAD
jgi:hypothetical protein